MEVAMISNTRAHKSSSFLKHLMVVVTYRLGVPFPTHYMQFYPFHVSGLRSLASGASAMWFMPRSHC
jgi:hypothetical protein